MAASFTVERFWFTLSTMGMTCHVSRAADGLPDVDLSAVNAARYRVRNDVLDRDPFYLACAVLTVPLATATTVSIRHAFTGADAAVLPVGSFKAWPEVSTDGGTTWYPTQTYQAFTVRDT